MIKGLASMTISGSPTAPIVIEPVRSLRGRGGSIGPHDFLRG
jgi:hypothetical protein